MKQQAEQELIRESVQIDKNINRAVAKLPFLCDPTDKLVDNRKAAERRLDNVVRKYKDEILIMRNSLDKVQRHLHIKMVKFTVYEDNMAEKYAPRARDQHY